MGSEDIEDRVPDSALPARVTYDEHVAPVLKAKCLDCHSSSGVNGIIGIDLEGFSNASTRYLSIEISSIDLNWMPPSFREKLTEYEKALLTKWNADGLPEN